MRSAGGYPQDTGQPTREGQHGGVCHRRPPRGGLDIQKLRDWEAGERLTRSDFLIVSGDFGYPWDFSPEECEEVAWLESRPYTLLFVDGNHERYDHWAERPYEEWHGGMTQRLSPDSPIRRLCRGEVFDLGGASIFTMGGATSVDRDWRHPYIDWWPMELPDEQNFVQAREHLATADWQIDYVITHTCASRMLATTLFPAPNCENPGTDRLTDFLDELEGRLAYKRWYYGHFHRDVDEKHVALYDNIVALGAGSDSW